MLLSEFLQVFSEGLQLLFDRLLPLPRHILAQSLVLALQYAQRVIILRLIAAAVQASAMLGSEVKSNGSEKMQSSMKAIGKQTATENSETTVVSEDQPLTRAAAAVCSPATPGRRRMLRGN